MDCRILAGSILHRTSICLRIPVSASSQRCSQQWSWVIKQDWQRQDLFQGSLQGTRVYAVCQLDHQSAVQEATLRWRLCKVIPLCTRIENRCENKATNLLEVRKGPPRRVPMTSVDERQDQYWKCHSIDRYVTKSLSKSHDRNTSTFKRHCGQRRKQCLVCR